MKYNVPLFSWIHMYIVAVASSALHTVFWLVEFRNDPHVETVEILLHCFREAGNVDFNRPPGIIVYRYKYELEELQRRLANMIWRNNSLDK
jgi:hypothetical protein